MSFLQGNISLLLQNTCLAHTSFVTLGVHDSSKSEELMARVVPLSSLCCVLREYQLMLGWWSTATYLGACLALLQGSCSRRLGLTGGEVDLGIIDTAMISNVFQA